MDEDIDPEMELLYQEDQRRLHAGDAMFPCPDCGRQNALTAEMKRRGYHCSACTRQVEEGW